MLLRHRRESLSAAWPLALGAALVGGGSALASPARAAEVVDLPVPRDLPAVRSVRVELPPGVSVSWPGLVARPKAHQGELACQRRRRCAWTVPWVAGRIRIEGPVSGEHPVRFTVSEHDESTEIRVVGVPGPVEVTTVTRAGRDSPRFAVPVGAPAVPEANELLVELDRAGEAVLRTCWADGVCPWTPLGWSVATLAVDGAATVPQVDAVAASSDGVGWVAWGAGKERMSGRTRGGSRTVTLTPLIEPHPSVVVVQVPGGGANIGVRWPRGSVSLGDPRPWGPHWRLSGEAVALRPALTVAVPSLAAQPCPGSPWMWKLGSGLDVTVPEVDGERPLDGRPTAGLPRSLSIRPRLGGGWYGGVEINQACLGGAVHVYYAAGRSVPSLSATYQGEEPAPNLGEVLPSGERPTAETAELGIRRVWTAALAAFAACDRIRCSDAMAERIHRAAQWTAAGHARIGAESSPWSVTTRALGPAGEDGEFELVGNADTEVVLILRAAKLVVEWFPPSLGTPALRIVTPEGSLQLEYPKDASWLVEFSDGAARLAAP